MERELRYKLLRNGATVESGSGMTVDIGSGGVAFALESALEPGAFIQLSISWPVMLEETCPMRLIIFGRVLRSGPGRCVCSVDKYEFRTQARTAPSVPARTDAMLERWAGAVRKEHPKRRLVMA